MSVAALRPHAEETFRHEALIYEGVNDFLDGTLEFVREGLAFGEPTLVIVESHKIDAMRSALGPDAHHVWFADMADEGRNPARIIPLWRDFVNEHAPSGRRLRGIGEPVGPDRTRDELAECRRHEFLLNLAFVDAPAFWLLCPYDIEALDASVIEEAQRSHPYLGHGRPGGHRSPAYSELDAMLSSLDPPLPEPEPDAQEAILAFGSGPLSVVRAFVLEQAQAAGLDAARAADLVVAANEVATNSLCHGGGQGTLRLWRTGGTVVCEVRDQGFIDDHLAGRRRPATYRDGGRGLWLANQLCDLVQIRSNVSGTVVRMHVRCH